MAIPVLERQKQFCWPAGPAWWASDPGEALYQKQGGQLLRNNSQSCPLVSIYTHTWSHINTHMITYGHTHDHIWTHIHYHITHMFQHEHTHDHTCSHMNTYNRTWTCTHTCEWGVRTVDSEWARSLVQGDRQGFPLVWDRTDCVQRPSSALCLLLSHLQRKTCFSIFKQLRRSWRYSSPLKHNEALKVLKGFGHSKRILIVI